MLVFAFVFEPGFFLLLKRRYRVWDLLYKTNQQLEQENKSTFLAQKLIILSHNPYTKQHETCSYLYPAFHECFCNG